MRAIKFRAWDKIDKSMNCSLGVVYFDNGDIKSYLTMEDQNAYETWKHDIILMQFTGFKDKNGKEIYEGDIFESPSGNLFKVVWYKDGWFHQHIFDEHVSGRLTDVAEDWKVIGNIFENPELMR